MFVNGVPLLLCSVIQKFVTLSVNEAEIAAGVMVAHYMLYLYQSLESIGLHLELPMVVEMDNSGAVGIANSWNFGGCTCHVDLRSYFLCELKTKECWSSSTYLGTSTMLTSLKKCDISGIQSSYSTTCRV